MESINTTTLMTSLGVSAGARSAFGADQTALAAMLPGLIAACSNYAVPTTSVRQAAQLLDSWESYDAGARQVLLAILPFGGGTVTISSGLLLAKVAQVKAAAAAADKTNIRKLDALLADQDILASHIHHDHAAESAANEMQISELITRLLSSGDPSDVDAVLALISAGLSSAAAIAATNRNDDTDDQVADARAALTLGLAAGSSYDPNIAAVALAEGWTYEEAVLNLRLLELKSMPPEQVIQHFAEIDALSMQLAKIDPGTLTGGNSGDPGGTYDTAIRKPFVLAGGTSSELGRQVIAQALADTGDDPSQIRRDEFEVILHETGKVTIVLPGVIDLSSPHLGLDPLTQSVRDTDQNALPSSFSSDVADNQYAIMVMEFVEQQIEAGAIDFGADVLLVGHSYGSDTAFDLASSPEFNGGLVNVTHVVGAAYNNETQLGDVQPNTQAMVLQNIYDLPVVAEGLGADATDTFNLVKPLVLPMAPVSPSEMVPQNGGAGHESVIRLVGEGIEETMNGAAHVTNIVADHAADMVEFGPLEFDVPDINTDIDLIGDSVSAINDHIVIAEFEGGFAGAGHEQSNYIDYTHTTTEELLDDIFVDIGETGYGADGVSIAVDVSVPDENAAADHDDQPGN